LNTPRVLIIAPHASYRTGPFISAAKQLGLDILIASDSAHSVVSAYAQGLHIDFAQTEQALTVLKAEARLQPFAAVIGTDDASTELAALLSQQLGLPYNDPAAIRIARRKDLARACLSKAGVPVPGHRLLDLQQPLAAQIENLEYPCVLKPLALAASQGVIRADDASELQQAVHRIAAIIQRASNSFERQHILAERFIPGIEVAVEGLLDDGKLQILSIFDKPDPLDGPFFEETYYITPTRLTIALQLDLKQQIAAACRAYGLRHGPIHAECRINQDGVWILEVAARTIGGLCARLLQFGTGYSLEQLVLAHASQQILQLQSESGGAGVLMIPIPEAGILRRIEGLAAARRVPYIDDIVISVREGYELIPLPEGGSYLGFIFARASSPALAEAALRAAHAKLNIVVAPLWRAAVG
jgi:biotin carboxylase